MFKFRLQPVLKYREFIEEQKKMELAEKQRAHLEEKKREDMLKDMRYRYHEAMRDETAQTDISVTKLAFFQTYIFVIEKQIARQQERVFETSKKMAAAQQVLVEAKRSKEVLVKAKESAYGRYSYDEAVKDQKLLDDMGTVRHMRSEKGMDAASSRMA
ncbi:MAG TPA: flagellar export protein FliJ [bacterium]|nr:MAG: Flagellar FliJ protein [bacterium ADurb.Bin236]HOY64931.1 flagellar export protein FliJ [bacterium]HPI75459.1 flagellar export protein FliJ [bacterium]HPN94217.1 flagellar export protein FliJ [bacterium]